MDVVYTLKDGENPEFRYSLRSLTNVPHDNVWAFGGIPRWTTSEVHHERVQQDAGSKYRNSGQNLRNAVTHPDVSDEFLLFNDDFFIVEPVTHVPTMHRGPIGPLLEQYALQCPEGEYTRGMRNTLLLLQRLGFRDPLSYELHVPMPVVKADAAALFAQITEWRADGTITGRIHWRSLYGNLYDRGGELAVDVKCYHLDQPLPSGPYVSTSDQVFRHGLVGTQLRDLFPSPSIYERPTREDPQLMPYRYINTTTDQIIDSLEPLPKLDMLARWKRVEIEAAAPAEAPAEAPADTVEPTSTDETPADESTDDGEATPTEEATPDTEIEADAEPIEPEIAETEPEKKPRRSRKKTDLDDASE